jgi:hypothetical protein
MIDLYHYCIPVGHRLKDLQDFLNHKLLNNKEEDLMLGGVPDSLKF